MPSIFDGRMECASYNARSILRDLYSTVDNWRTLLDDSESIMISELYEGQPGNAVRPTLEEMIDDVSGKKSILDAFSSEYGAAFSSFFAYETTWGTRLSDCISALGTLLASFETVYAGYTVPGVLSIADRGTLSEAIDTALGE